MLKLALKPVTELMRAAVIATYPKYMRDMAGLHQSAAVDAAVVPPMKAFHKLLETNLQLRLAFMARVAPQAVPVAAPAVLGIPPKNDKVWGVREAQAHFGFDVPAEAHPDVRAKQRDRVFNKGLAPSDEGLEESQKYIGTMDVHHPARVG